VPEVAKIPDPPLKRGGNLCLGWDHTLTASDDDKDVTDREISDL